MNKIIILLACATLLSACDTMDYRQDYYSSNNSSGYVKSSESDVTSGYNHDRQTTYVSKQTPTGGYSSSQTPAGGGYSSSQTPAGNGR